MTAAPLPAWWQALAERAAQAPQGVRLDLRIEGVATRLGSIEPALAARLHDAGLPVSVRDDGAWLAGDADASLERIARWLSAQRLVGRWRGELLGVADDEGVQRAVVERAAVRALGIATRAVHLIGLTARGDVWVQRRALDKATDPGLWDTLMGGMVAARESAASALERETWEEAGLRPAQLQDLRRAASLALRCPVPEGYRVERIDVFEAVVPQGLRPVNQDGEVERFECLAPAVLIERLAAGEFTLEAALMLAGSLHRRGCL